MLVDELRKNIESYKAKSPDQIYQESKLELESKYKEVLNEIRRLFIYNSENGIEFLKIEIYSNIGQREFGIFNYFNNKYSLFSMRNKEYLTFLTYIQKEFGLYYKITKNHIILYVYENQI